MNKEKWLLVIGVGGWGKNYIRTLIGLGYRNIICSDLSCKNLIDIKKRYPAVKLISDYKTAILSYNIKETFVITPPITHFDIVKYLLVKGINVLVEKPITLSTKKTNMLISLARYKNCILMVGHLYKYNNFIQMIKKNIQNKLIGNIYYIKSERMGLSPIRKDVNVLWDLAIHDIYIINYLLGEKVCKYSIDGGCYLSKRIEDYASINLKYYNNVLANISVSWLYPEKIRKLSVIGSKGTITFDEINNKFSATDWNIVNNQKVNVKQYNYNMHCEFDSFALTNQIECFMSCSKSDTKPLTSADNEIDTMYVIEKLQRLLKKDKL